jgi:hypothetical protein
MADLKKIETCLFIKHLKKLVVSIVSYINIDLKTVGLFHLQQNTG